MLPSMDDVIQNRAGWEEYHRQLGAMIRHARQMRVLPTDPALDILEGKTDESLVRPDKTCMTLDGFADICDQIVAVKDERWQQMIERAQYSKNWTCIPFKDNPSHCSCRSHCLSSIAASATIPPRSRLPTFRMFIRHPKPIYLCEVCYQHRFTDKGYFSLLRKLVVDSLRSSQPPPSASVAHVKFEATPS